MKGVTRMFHSDVTLEDIIEHFRAKGIRITQSRTAIIDYLMNSRRHPTVEEIYQDLLDDHPGISLATVYNNLHFLMDEGLVYEIKLSSKTSRYDFLGDRHSHIICHRCGKISDFLTNHISHINGEAEDQTGFLVEETQIELSGLCPQCQSELQEKE